MFHENTLSVGEQLVSSFFIYKDLVSIAFSKRWGLNLIMGMAYTLKNKITSLNELFRVIS